MSGISPVSTNYGSDAAVPANPPPDVTQEVPQQTQDQTQAQEAVAAQAATTTVFTATVPQQVNTTA